MSEPNTSAEPRTVLTWSSPRMISTDDLLSYPEFVTLSSPALLKLDTTLYICFRERDDSLWISASEDGESFSLGSYKIQKALLDRGVLRYIPFSPTVDNSIYTLYRPTLAYHSGYAYLSWTNKSDSIIGLVRTSDPSPPLQKTGTNWTALSNVTTPTTAGSGPSIASFNGRLFLAYRDTSSNIYIGSLGTSWSSFQIVQDAYSVPYKSLDGPTLLAVTTGGLATRLWISFRQVNSFYFGYATLNANGYTIDSWTMNIVSTPCSNVEMPVVALYGNNLYAAYQGSDQKICFGASYDGASSWGDWGVLDNNLSLGAPALANHGSIFTMAFQAFSFDTGRRFIMTCYHDFNATSSKTKKQSEEKKQTEEKKSSTN